MLGKFIFGKTQADYENKILICVQDDFLNTSIYTDYFKHKGFNVINYRDDLHFRIKYSYVLEDDDNKYLIIANENDYIPYDILTRFNQYVLSVSNLFQKLYAPAIKEYPNINYDLLALAYEKNFDDLDSDRRTLEFIKNKVYDKENIIKYVHLKNEELDALYQNAKTYSDWFDVADLKAKIDILCVKYEISLDTAYINDKFCDFITDNYGTLNGEINPKSPVIISKVMNYITNKSDKFALIVMDGMSQFDWEIISNSFSEIKYNKADIFAMIPTITSVSRQCLLSGKVPMQLEDFSSLAKEEKEFKAYAKYKGFTDNQIAYERGYNVELSAFVKCAAIIINEIDDIVHAQKLGRHGMYHDIKQITKEGRLVHLVRKLLLQGFDVFITSDHGNTNCTGIGKPRRFGIETQTKSNRTIILKDFANIEDFILEYEMSEYPGYYLDKKYKYLIFKDDRAFMDKDGDFLNHGGITIDEVIVPFITVQVKENG